MPASAFVESPPLSSNLNRLNSPLVRLALGCALLCLEVFIFTVCFDTAALLNKTGLLTLISDFGPWIARGLAALLVAFFAVTWTGRARTIEGPAIEITGINLPWLIGHGAALTAFSWLTSRLFSTAASTGWNALALAWMAAGLFLAATALLAFVPGRAFLSMLRVHQAVWKCSVAIAAVACAIGGFSWVISRPVHRATFQAVRWCLTAVLPGVHIDPVRYLLESGSFAVFIAPSCSGVEGIGLIIAFGAGWIWFFGSDYRFPNARSC